MPQHLDILPDGFETKVREDGRAVRLVFSRDNGDRWSVELETHAAGLVGEALLRDSGKGPRPTAQPDDLQIGGTFVLEGHSVRPRPEGGAILTLFVQLDDRTVTLPVDLPPRELGAIMEALNRCR